MGYFKVSRNPSRIDATRGDHFLQADFSLPIRTMTAVSVVCAEVQIFRTTRNSALPLIMRVSFCRFFERMR